MKRMDREEIIRRVMRKYGYARWEVEFAADHLLGAEYSQRATIDKDKSPEKGNKSS